MRWIIVSAALLAVGCSGNPVYRQSHQPLTVETAISSVIWAFGTSKRVCRTVLKRAASGLPLNTGCVLTA